MYKNMNDYNKFINTVANAFSTLEHHDFFVQKVALSNDILEQVQNFTQGNSLFGAEIISTNGKGHVKVFTKDSQFMNELFIDEPFDPQIWHDPSNPKCSVCKIKYKEFIGMDKIEVRCYPGCSSIEGFLRRDEKLQDVINQDEETLKRLNVTYERIADRLQEIQEKAIKQWNDFKDVNVEDLKVKCTGYLGYQDCPWGCKGRDALSDHDFTIINPAVNQAIFCSQLHPHLIRKHKFFEGHTKYRVDPEIAIRILNIREDKCL